MIVDNSLVPDKSHLEIAKSALDGGAKILQFRAKNLTQREFYIIVNALTKLTQVYNALLIVNDYVEIAKAVGAGGVHLGADDLSIQQAKIIAPDLIIGRSTHSLEEALEMDKQGADYIAFGAIFPTQTKKRPTPVQGLEKLKQVCDSVKKPVVAIGGIKRENLIEVKKAGASAVAFISEIVCADSIEKRIKELIKLWEGN